MQFNIMHKKNLWIEQQIISYWKKNLTCVLRTLKTYNPTIKILKYVVILIIGQSLATKLVISLGYNLNIYIYIYIYFFFIGDEF